ncbi:MAG: hypothetical protein IPQ07_38075 [Myxococcales bacterium]|nr:hypothetical protein [Myxococcales bacterium]
MNPLDTTLRLVRCNPTDPEPTLTAEVSPENLARLREYLSTRDPEKIPLAEGTVPTWFVVKRLPAAYLSSVLEGIYPRAAQREHAVRAALHRVELPGGEALSVVPRKSAPKGAPFTSTEAAHGVSLAGDDWIQELADRFGAETIQEMGEAIIDLSRLPRGRRGPFSHWGGTVAGR